MVAKKIDALKIGTFQIAYSMRDEKNMCPVEFICDDENAPKDNRPEVIFGAAFLFQGVRLNNTAVYFHKRGECYGIVDEIQKKLKSGKVTIEFNSDKILSIKNWIFSIELGPRADIFFNTWRPIWPRQSYIPLIEKSDFSVLENLILVLFEHQFIPLAMLKI